MDGTAQQTEITRWPHQVYAVSEVKRLRDAGERRICVTSPTGGGKSLVAADLIQDALARKEQSVLYTNRKLLVEQLSRSLDDSNIDHGIRAADYDDQREKPVQISSLPTESSRVYRKGNWKLHPAKLVLIDEAHLHKKATAQRIIDDHISQGATVVGITATPIDLGAIYTSLVVAGTNSELRKCGALVPAYHYGPDEPDCSYIKKSVVDFTEGDVRKAIMTTTIFARVFEWYKRLNPDQRPSLLFAPGVAESIYFAEQFQAEGVRAAHIDGEECWLDGNYYKSSKQLRADILGGSEDGSIKVVCNRFVLREGVNAPWIYHGIFATIFSAMQAYLQSGGRLLRAHPSMDRVIVQDHGGAWWRHGSLNEDRTWDLSYDDRLIATEREEAFRAKTEQEPARCPKCALILIQGRCFGCGFEIVLARKSRPVIQQDGTLKNLEGDIFRPRVTRLAPDTAAKWKTYYFRMKNAGKTFRQAEALFFLDNGYYPPRSLPYMPVEPGDWGRRIKDVAPTRLRWPAAQTKEETRGLFEK